MATTLPDGLSRDASITAIEAVHPCRVLAARADGGIPFEKATREQIAGDVIVKRDRNGRWPATGSWRNRYSGVS